MSDNKEDTKKELFFPYYINQGRLLDIYAILNGGYSEYAEISTAISAEKTKNGQFEMDAKGGFKVLNFGGDVSANLGNSNTQSTENKEKKVQTITSVLSLIKTTLKESGYLHEILQSNPGDFVCLPVVLSINSIKSLLSEISNLLKLSESMQRIGASISGVGKNNTEYEKILKTMQSLFEGEEIIYQTDDYAITGNIVDANLYQAVRADIIGTHLNCLAQVKRVFPQGTQLMKNTIFSKIMDQKSKKKLIDAISSIANGDVFSFDSIAVPSIDNKPVYQLEIIALYQ